MIKYAVYMYESPNDGWKERTVGGVVWEPFVCMFGSLAWFLNKASVNHGILNGAHVLTSRAKDRRELRIIRDHIGCG